jgi:glutathione S-transferase
LFRLGPPAVRDAWPTSWERALYTLVKERRYGAGAIESWEADRGGLLLRGRALLAPTARTLERRPFLFGDAPTLADLALYGQYMMLEEADPELLPSLGEVFTAHARRIAAIEPAAG